MLAISPYRQKMAAARATVLWLLQCVLSHIWLTSNMWCIILRKFRTFSSNPLTTPLLQQWDCCLPPTPCCGQKQQNETLRRLPCQLSLSLSLCMASSISFPCRHLPSRHISSYLTIPPYICVSLSLSTLHLSPSLLLLLTIYFILCLHLYKLILPRPAPAPNKKKITRETQKLNFADFPPHLVCFADFFDSVWKRWQID